MNKVAVVFGSDSDWSTMQKAVDTFRDFEIDLDIHVEAMSAHRNPARVLEFASTAKDEGFDIIISAAGMSNALSGSIAAHTTVPVIAVPLSSKNLDGLDSLLASIQMPPGIPVACVSIDGAKNAALLAIQMLALRDSSVAAAYKEYKAYLAIQVRTKNDKLQEYIKSEYPRVIDGVLEIRR